MPDLEKSIAEWRKQMLTAGISAAALDELEGHLREEIARQIQAGTAGPEAFASATAQIGRADLLKTEFKKSGGFLSWLGETRDASVRRVLALLWLTFCTWAFFTVLSVMASAVYGRRIYYGDPPVHFPAQTYFITVLFFLGIIAGIRLFAGNNGAWPKWTLLLIATYGLVGNVNLAVHFPKIALSFSAFSFSAIAFTAFYLASIWLLWPQRKAKLATS